eukprot:UN12683
MSSMELDTPHKKKSQKAVHSSKKKEQAKFKIWDHVYVKKNSKPTSKIYSCEFRDAANKRKSNTFGISDIAEVVAFVKKHHNKTLNIATTKIPFGLNDPLKVQIRDHLNSYLHRKYTLLFINEFQNLLESHGPHSRKNYENRKIRHNDIIIDESNKWTWNYVKFHVAANIDDEEKDIEDPFTIYGMYRKMPHFQNVIFKYRERFLFDEFQLNHMDILIMVMSGAITVTMNDQTF